MVDDWRIAEIILEDSPKPFWRMLLQLGVNEVVGVLPRSFADWRRSSAEQPWDYYPLARYKRMIEEERLKLVAIEDNPPMDAIRCGTDGKEEELENVCKLIENMGKLGIGTWCYNWMTYLGWIRTSTRLKTRGNAVVTGFNEDVVKSAPPIAKEPITSEVLWRNLESFLKVVIPVAESAGVKLAMHPDDPPMLPSIRGISRIMNNVSSFDRLLEIYPSEANGITLCQGNFTLMTDDLPSVIRHFGRTGKIFFVHFRDVLGDASKFTETFLDDGKTDMVGCMRAYKEIGFKGIMRCDHTPTLEGDEETVPGYSALGRLHAIGYITGLKQAVFGTPEKGKNP
jgi:mannonate dehydratase